VLDADSHLSERCERLAELIDPDYRHLAPAMVEQDGREMLSVAGRTAPIMEGFTWGDINTPDGLKPGARRYRRWNEADPAGIDPRARLRLMDGFGIQASVIFPSIGLRFGALQPPDLSAALCRGLNRYLAEFCTPDRARLWPTATVPVRDLDLACREAEYAVRELGSCAIFVPSFSGERPIYALEYEPLLETVEGLGVPLCIHNGGIIMSGGLGLERFPGSWPAFHLTSHVVEGMLACLGFLTSGVLERHPNLKAGFMEAGASWVPYLLSKLDEKVEATGCASPLPRSALAVFKAQCLVTAEAGEPMLAVAFGLLDGQGVAWASDLPHFDV